MYINVQNTVWKLTILRKNEYKIENILGKCLTFFLTLSL